MVKNSKRYRSKKSKQKTRRKKNVIRKQKGGFDIYAALGSKRSDSVKKIKRKFRQLIRKYHTDKPGGDARLSKYYLAAWNIISDNDNKRDYDREIRSGKSAEEAFDFVMGRGTSANLTKDKNAALRSGAAAQGESKTSAAEKNREKKLKKAREKARKQFEKERAERKRKAQQSRTAAGESGYRSAGVGRKESFLRRRKNQWRKQEAGEDEEIPRHSATHGDRFHRSKFFQQEQARHRAAAAARASASAAEAAAADARWFKSNPRGTFETDRDRMLERERRRRVRNFGECMGAACGVGAVGAGVGTSASIPCVGAACLGAGAGAIIGGITAHNLTRPPSSIDMSRNGGKRKKRKKKSRKKKSKRKTTKKKRKKHKRKTKRY